MTKHPPKPLLTRRAVLRGAGALLTLPAMESWSPIGSRTLAAASAAATQPSAPVRLAFLYVPNGVNLAKWHVQGDGKDYVLSPTLEPLAKLKDQFTLFSGLNHDKANSNGDGAGDHSRAAATYLTGCQAKKTGGADIRLGISVDQIAAAKVGRDTRLPSLELSTEGERSAGTCDSGYSCAYQYNLSWKNETQPIPPERNPRMVFERLFGFGAAEGDTGAGAADGQRRLGKSVLDFVLDEARSMRPRLNPADTRKLDQYFQGVREVEQRIERAEKTKAEVPDARLIAGVPASYQEHIRVMFDLLVLAFQSDSTRVATFMLAHEGSNRSFAEIGVPQAHHQLSHHRGAAEKLERIARIDRFYTEQLAYFLQRLKETREANHSLLDQCMVVYGSGISDGNQHLHSDLPVLVAGGGGGALHPGRHIKLPDPTPMTNLYLALLERLGVRAERVGDSTGLLREV
jgi:hypothetical protein